MKSVFQVPSWCHVSCSCFKANIQKDWSEIYKHCSGTEDLREAVCLLTGFVSGVVSLYTEHEAVKEWVNQHISISARWVVYRDGWITFLAHQSRTMFENFFCDDAEGKVQEVIAGTYRPIMISKPMPRGTGTLHLHEPEFVVTPSGELLIEDKGILHISADGSCIQLEPKLRLELALSTVVFRNTFIKNNFQENAEFN